MMAIDRTPSPELSPETMASLRGALDRALRHELAEDELQQLLRGAATEARERDITAEQLLILLKRIWGDLPGLRMVSDPGTRTRILQQIISRCIREYYRD